MHLITFLNLCNYIIFFCSDYSTTSFYLSHKKHPQLFLVAQKLWQMNSSPDSSIGVQIY